MLINKAFRFKLKPTRKQRQLFRQFAGAVRWVWNECLAERKRIYEETGESVSQYEQMRRLTRLKRETDTAWLKTIHSQVLQEPIKNLQQGFKSFFEGRNGYPRFKSKKHIHQSFTYPQGVKVQGNRVYLPKIGWVRFYKSREIEGKIKRATIKRQASGWYISITCEVTIDPPDIQPTPDGTLGIDLGLNDFIVTSDGERVKAPQYLRDAERKLAREQRKLSRKQRGSNRYKKQHQRVARLHERVRNMRQDFLHKLSTRLVRENQAIIVEDLNVEGLAQTRLAKSVYDAGWGEFVRQLEYKCRWAGKAFHKVDQFFPSTKTCHHCGTLNEVSLSDREFICQGCGHLVDRDYNAAQNIKERGLLDLNVAAGQTETLNARGAKVRPATAGTSR